MRNVEFFDIKTFSLKNISLYIQLFLIICLFGTIVASIFIKNDIMTLIIQIILALTMLIMAYNNKKIYKRKYMTYIYLAFSVILIGSVIVDIVW